MSYIRITARPRTLKGRPVRGVPPSQLICRNTDDENPLELQHRYHSSRSQSAPSDLYWSFQGQAPTGQSVTRALQHILSILQISPPPLSFYASHSLRSGSVTALVLLGVPMPVIVRRGPWADERLVTNVYFDGRLFFSPEMEQYFWSLLPRSKLPPPQ